MLLTAVVCSPSAVGNKGFQYLGLLDQNKGATTTVSVSSPALRRESFIVVRFSLRSLHDLIHEPLLAANY